MTTVAALLSAGRDALAADRSLSSPGLDVELLLAHVLERPRVWLRAWPEAEVDPAQARQFHALLARRSAGEPIAYLLGQREFWSLSLAVCEGVLIPRPETERVVELALALGPAGAPARVLDLGTGSGAIALALASERPGWQVLGLDIDPANVMLAAANGQRLGLDNVAFVCGSWFDPLSHAARFDLIVSNPPYIAAEDPHLQQGDVRFEPRRALVAEDQGLADLCTIVQAAPGWLRAGGWLLLEHGWQQGAAVVGLLREAGFESVQSWTDHAGHDRVSGGCWRG